MTKYEANPTRFSEQTGTGSAAQDLAADLCRELRAAPRMHPAVSARIDRRVASLMTGRVRRPRWPLVLAATSLLLAGGAVAAIRGVLPLPRIWFGKADVENSERSPRRARPRPVAPAPIQPAIEVLPSAEPAEPAAAIPAAPIADEPVKTRARTTGRIALRSVPAVPAAAPPASAQPSALARESEQLGRAVAALRRQGQASTALALLDSYDAGFPRGTLQLEALAVRVDALLALDRPADALARLDALPAPAFTKVPRLRVIRGELRAKAGHLDGAIADFDASLGTGSPTRASGDLGGRALYGRATCRARQSRVADARQDFELYLRLYPEGRFASHARQALGR